ncbi:uncharacterized protein EAF01_007632 [Botrytis porri]|uniref:uncharacterized protein n=1 Tax=Botrytis porri TaxID=87229 RepID=UPI001901E42C|nr:uncharacterized protein EAF01_007632 [Botrytis porri]KAF7900330.1 hypothetical protein EAF01_007632 [Botrytis porri]
MTDHTPDSPSSGHNEPREMKLEYKTEKDLDSSSGPKDELEEEYSISDVIFDLVRSSTSDISHKDSQTLRDECKEIKATSVPSDGKIQSASRNECFYELVTAGRFHGITSSTLDFIYTTLDDKNVSKMERSDRFFSALGDELFKEDEEVLFEKFPKLPLEVRTMIWEQALLEAKVVRIGIVPTERTIGHWQYCWGDLVQIDHHEPMLLERNHILKTPPCSLLSVNRESRDQALQVHGVFWEQKRPFQEAEDGYVSIKRIYVNWEIDTVWLDYNLSIAWRDNIMDPSDRKIIPMPAYEEIRRLAIPAESIEWPCDMHASDTGLAIADFPDLEELTLLVPTKETALGAGLESFIDDDEYDIVIEDFDMEELRDCVYCVFQHTLEDFYSSDKEEEIAAGYIRDLSTWEWPEVQYMEVSTIEKEKVKVRVKALLDVLPAEVYEKDDEDTVGRRRALDFAKGITLWRNLR